MSDATCAELRLTVKQIDEERADFEWGPSGLYANWAPMTAYEIERDSAARNSWGELLENRL